MSWCSSRRKCCRKSGAVKRLPMCTLVGVDGCKGKWLAVAQDKSGNVSASLHASPENLLESFPNAEVIAVDVPIGLTETGRRKCDEEARDLLGSPRRNSVFPAPIRPMLYFETREEASEAGKRIDGRGVGCQAWGIFPYVKSWDDALRNDGEARGRVYEVHPEVCFYGMNNNGPMQFSKKKKPGCEERRKLLDQEFGEPVIMKALGGLRGKGFALDDLYDAFAALWSARRIANRTAKCLPAVPPRDEQGLLMAIYY